MICIQEVFRAQLYVYKVGSLSFLDNWVEVFSIYLLIRRNVMAIIVILQVKVLSSPSKKRAKKCDIH